MKTHLNYLNIGSGVPIVFQHGLGADIGQVKGVFGNMADIQLVGMDCPGHGGSPLQSTMPSFDFYTDILIKLLDELNIENAFLGGISMGSGIALNLALKQPTRVRGLILVRPAWLDQTCPENLDILLKVAALFDDRNGQDKVAQLAEFQEIKAVLPKAAASIMGLFERQQLATTSSILRHMVGDRPFEHMSLLKNLDIPTLIITNENDPLHPFSMASALQKNILGSQLHKVTSRYVDDSRHKGEVQKLIKNFSVFVGKK